MGYGRRGGGQRHLKRIQRTFIVLQRGVDNTSVVIIQQEMFGIKIPVLRMKKKSCTPANKHKFSSIASIAYLSADIGNIDIEEFERRLHVFSDET